MRGLSASELLHAWEQGQGETPARRALLLIALACDQSIEVLARLTIGARDARLFTLRLLTFGSQLTSVTTCKECSERLELSFDVSDLNLADHPVADELSFDEDEYEIRFRLPDSLDLMAAATVKERGEAHALLLERCIRSAYHRGDLISAARLPENIVGRVAEQMSAADPQADIQIALQCSACGNQLQVSFDIESFFWKEICAWAPRILNEVHILASAYGWSEQEILGMSAWRRECYLNLVSG